MRTHCSPGFTLLELIIVMTLATMAVGLVSLLFANTLPSARLEATAGEIAAYMRQLKAIATTNGEDALFVVDLDAKRYGIEGGSWRAIPAEISVRAEDPFEGEIRSGEYRVLFHAVGGVEGGALLLSFRQKSLRIEADPILGAHVERR